MSASQYGFSEQPPYSLYKAENGKWGLIDGKGAKLEAVFDRIDEDRFSKVPWEVVTFDPKEGFSLLAWYDPCEVWFNFTWENPAYPEEFADLLWKKSEHNVEYYRDTIYEVMPDENHWLIDNILNVENLDRTDDDNEYYRQIEAMLKDNPGLANAYVTNPMLDPVMRNNQINTDIKIALWQAKVGLDSIIKNYKEEYPDGI